MSDTADLVYRVESLESGMEELQTLAKELADRLHMAERAIEMRIDSKMGERLHHLRDAIGAMLNDAPKVAKDALEAFDEF